jgi:hypothetical protein
VVSCELDYNFKLNEATTPHSTGSYRKGGVRVAF